MAKVVLIVVGGQGTMAAGPDVEVVEYSGLHSHKMTVEAEHRDREAKREAKAARDKKEKEEKEERERPDERP